MPKRTNAFQDLVSLVQKALAPTGAKVTESALVEGSGTGEPREIDVLIETEVGPYHLKIAVEAKDHRRKMDSTQFESLIGKYFVEGGVKVNKVVVVTHSGFFQPVIDRAKQIGVELMTLREAQNVNWKKLYPEAEVSNPVLMVADLETTPAIPEELRMQVFKEGRVRCSHGKIFGNVYQFATALLRTKTTQDQRAALIKALSAADLQSEDRKPVVSYSFDHEHYIELQPAKFPLEQLKFTVQFARENQGGGVNGSQLRFQFAPHICHIELTPAIPGATPRTLAREARVICRCCDKDHGNVAWWAGIIVNRILRERREFVQQFEEALNESPSGEARMTVAWDSDNKKFVRYEGNDFEVNSVSVTIHAASATTPLDCKHLSLSSAEGDETLVSHFEGIAAGKSFTIVVPHAKGKPAEKIVVKIGDKPK